LRKKEHKWQNIVLKPGEKPLEGITGELFEIKAQIEPREAKQVGFKIRGIGLLYDVKRQEIRCLGEDGPLKMTDGRIKLHLLVDRTSLEVFGNDGLLSMSSCMLPDHDNRSLAVFCRGGRIESCELRLCQLKSIWNN
jgi:sucrose-6-phosphate hydrolase SacC (GH32 family)